MEKLSAGDLPPGVLEWPDLAGITLSSIRGRSLLPEDVEALRNVQSLIVLTDSDERRAIRASPSISPEAHSPSPVQEVTNCVDFDNLEASSVRS